MPTIFIDGDQGTTGLRIASRLAARQELTLLTLPEAQRKSLPHRLDMARRADVVFLCLPDEASREMVVAFAAEPDCAATLIDASTAHRTSPSFAYGFPELGPAFRQSLRTSRRIAVPGCHAGGAVALLYPLLKAGVLGPEASVTLVSLTGYSGGGKAMIADYQAKDRDPALRFPRPYATGQCHKHLPEIQRICGLTDPPVLDPIVCDFYSGMLVGLSLTGQQLAAMGQSGAKARGMADFLTTLYRDHYAQQPLLTVLEPNPEPFLNPAALAGTDGLQLFVTGNDQRMIVYARFDNLGKGASGAAIQCMNLRLGLPENAGLTLPNPI